MVDGSLITFYITAIYVVVCALMTVKVERVMQSATWLILMLIGIAMLFLLANSEILFAYQLIVYAGGISVLLLFASLLTELDELGFDNSVIGIVKATKYQILIFLLFGINLLYLTINGFGQQDGILGDQSFTVDQSQATIRDFAIALWDDFGMIIPILGLLLLTAILGSVKLVIREWEIEELSDEMKMRYRDELIQEVVS
jgi:NADH-quinone oxidoreductase subunit J